MITRTESRERAPTLALPRKRERGRTAVVARVLVTYRRLLRGVMSNKPSARRTLPPLPLAREGRGGAATASANFGKRHSAARIAS